MSTQQATSATELSTPQSHGVHTRESSLLFCSLAVGSLNILVYWGHRVPGIRILADMLTWVQQLSIGWVGEYWFIRVYFLFPMVCWAVLVCRFFRPGFHRSWPYIAGLVGNGLLVLHAWFCFGVLTR